MLFMDMWSTAIAVLASGIYIGDSEYYNCNQLKWFAFSYFMVDLLSCKMVNKLHHICTLGILYQVDNHDLLMFFYKVEISTIFFNLIPYVKYKSLFKAIFFSLFIKIRVYDYYYFLVDYDSNMPLCVRFSFYTLYAINLYWFSLLIKKVWGNRTQGPYYETLCQQINRFSYFGTIPFFIACPRMAVVYGFITITSFFYHNAILYNKHKMFWFVLDSIAIHSVLLLHIISVNQPNFLFLSIWINLFSLIHRIAIVDFNNIRPSLSMSYYPVLVDSIIILCSEIPTRTKFDYLLQLYAMGLILYIEFFNDMSYICFHIACWFNANTLSKLICT